MSNTFEIDDYLVGDPDDYCADCGTRFDGLGYCPFCDFEPDDPEWLFFEPGDADNGGM